MATTPIAAATPSPPPHIHTPPGPRLGFADSWEPFSPRKSSRIAASKNSSAKPSSAARTPSPSANVRRAVRQPRSPKLSKQAKPSTTHLQPHPTHLDVAALSPAPTPRKKKTMPTAHFLSPEDTKSKKGEASSTTFSRMGAGMLPTPHKTPSKKVHAASQNESNIAAIARNLFHTDVDEVMASPSKTPSRKGKKYTGFSLESFAEVEDEEPIPIFTDSQDRVPEADNSAENPFFGDGTAPVTLPSAASAGDTRRRSKRNQVSIPGEGKQSVEEATRREDGLVYVFRGKKIFRKFDDSADAVEEDILDGMTPGGNNQGKRMTRSAIKPRLLFPREDSSFTETTPNGSTTDDEEADTDIEEGNHVEEEEEDEEDEVEETEPAFTSAPNTPPPAPKFSTPASPPTTMRTRRSGHKAAEELTPVKAAAPSGPMGAVPKKRSPFDGWRQTKSSASAAGQKRNVDALGSSPTAAKRSRT